MAKRKKKVWKAVDWLPTMRKAMKRGAKTFMLLMLDVGSVDYKAPHAPRGTPARRLALYAGAPRIFKGHRS